MKISTNIHLRFSSATPYDAVRQRFNAAQFQDFFEFRAYEHSTYVEPTVRDFMISEALDHWAYINGVVMDFSRPGKQMDNAVVESFNGRFRDECLNTHWFLSLDDARTKIEAWRRHYNE